MKRFFLFTSLSLCLLVGSYETMAATDKVYQWKDSNGRLHFSDKPPLDSKTKTKQVDVDFIHGKQPASEKNKETATQEKTNDTEEKPAISSSKNPEQCKKVRANLQQLLSSKPLRFTDKDGNTGLITAAERKKQIDRLKKLEKDYCD